MTLLLTHGAGSSCESHLLKALDLALTATGVTVIRFNLPYRDIRPTGPPRYGDDVTARAAIRRRAEQADRPVIAGGHSYGGRQTSILAAEDPSLLDGLFLLAYPLHPPRKPDQPRTSHFAALRTPALFIHGDRDPFGSAEEMHAALELISARKQIMLLERAGHELTNHGPSMAAGIITAFHEFFG
ncbi:MAG TPA: alpha/beta fold hydrolase [Bryobacteraceae bacterium]|nr:alpha/beta fold hydrolase [Bryobacteraceae bacterium]